MISRIINKLIFSALAVFCFLLCFESMKQGAPGVTFGSIIGFGICFLNLFHTKKELSNASD